MHAIHELICGIRGAENGTVDIYRRGTSTRVTYYTSFEGDGSTTPTGATTLDSNGGGEFYVNETVDVVVRDSGGTEIRRFTSAPAASAVEVISQSFTGTDYTSGATGASKPITLKDVLDRWYTNAGEVDWKVRVGGTATTLSNAFATVGSAFVNVKAVAYGAVGDGNADDTSACQAALDAASSAGGGTVYFPKGTYKITSALSVPALVSLLGDGPGASVIKNHTVANANTFTFAASPTYPAFVRGLRMYNSNSNSTGNHIQAHSGNIIRIDDCYIGSSTTHGRCVSIDTAGTKVFITNSTLEVGNNGGGTQNHVRSNTTSANSVAHLFGCTIVLPTGANEGACIRVNGGSCIACTFTTTQMTSGSSATLFIFDAESTGCEDGALVAGCVAANPGGGTLAIGGGGAANIANGDGWFGNRFGTSLTRSGLGATPAKSTYFGTGNFDRERGRYYALDDSAAITIGATKYAEIEIERSTTGAQTVSVDNVGPVGLKLIFVYNNQAQGSATGTITFNAAQFKGITTFTVNANKWSVYFFESVHVGTANYWVLRSSQTNL